MSSTTWTRRRTTSEGRVCVCVYVWDVVACAQGVFAGCVCLPSSCMRCCFVCVCVRVLGAGPGQVCVSPLTAISPRIDLYCRARRAHTHTQAHEDTPSGPPGFYMIAAATARVRGTKDLFPAECARFARIEAVFRRVATAMGYGELRTPVLEHLAVFNRSLGATSDVISKEMFLVRTNNKDLDRLCLRPEATAGACAPLPCQRQLNVGGCQ